MRKSTTPDYKPVLKEGEKLITMLSPAVFDSILKQMWLFPEKDAIFLDHNKIYDRRGASCSIEVDISELMKENKSKAYYYERKRIYTDILTMNIFNDDKLKNVISGGEVIYVIEDEANNLIWFKNEYQEVSVNICRRHVPENLDFQDIDKTQYVTSLREMDHRSFKEIRRIARKEEFVDLMVSGDKLLGIRTEDQRKYTLSSCPEPLGDECQYFRSYHFLPIKCGAMKLRIARIEGEYILHGSADYARSKIKIHEYLRTVGKG